MIILIEPVILKINRKSKVTDVRQNIIVNSDQDIQPGDIVSIRSEQEIMSTLNADGKYKGLGFMPEMSKYCGKRFRVMKKVTNIMIESTGESRKIKSPTFILEGAYCDGEFHQKCDRSCFFFWKGEWLKKEKN